MADSKSGLFTRLRNYFLTGILITVPLGVTVALVAWIAGHVDALVIALIPEPYNPITVAREAFGVSAAIPGLGLIIVVASITAIGALTAGLLGRWLVGLGESVVNRMPVVRSLYSAVKQLLETVLRNKSDSFRHAVLVEYPRQGLWAVGFVTTATRGELSRRLRGDYVNVFLPTTPNPTSGFLLFVPRGDVIELDMSVEDAVKMVISAGIVTPEEQFSGAERLLAGKMTHAQLEEKLYGMKEHGVDGQADGGEPD